MIVLGNAEVSVHGMTLKTKVKKTIFFDDVRDFCEKHSGAHQHVYPPVFKGEMKDGKWNSPWVNALLPTTHVEPRYDYAFLALCDYICGMENLETKGYREISFKEAITGIPKTVIQSADLNTSMGPPFFCKKKFHIQRYPDETVAISPELLAQYNEIGEILDEDSIPRIVASATLKDEPVSQKKNDERKCRVFQCVSFGANAHMAQILAPIESFMRMYHRFFESKVGINMTSSEVDALVKEFVGFIGRLFDKDTSQMDASMSGSSMMMVSLFFYSASFVLGTRPSRARTIVEIIRNAIIMIKNDFCIRGKGNVSGGKPTIAIASAENAITERIVYYRMKYPDGLPDRLASELLAFHKTFMVRPVVPDSLVPYLTFRKHVLQAVYGDDFLGKVSTSCDFYDLSKIEGIGLEMGKFYTDGAKLPEIRWKELSEVTFLKRSFVYWEDLGMFVGKLSVKSIVKMLTVHGATTLTESDHHACLLTDVLREAVYHGRLFYDELKMLVENIAVKYSLDKSKYYIVKTFDEHFDSLKNGAFSAWTSHVN